VRRYLPLLLAWTRSRFYATDAGEPVLEALTALRLSDGRRKLTAEVLRTGYIPRPWQRLVEPEPGRVDGAAYTMCTLEELRDGLRRRDRHPVRAVRRRPLEPAQPRVGRLTRGHLPRAVVSRRADAFIEQLAADVDDTDGVLDVALDEGFVSVGASADTAQFAAASILAWWQQLGAESYPDRDVPDDHRRLRRFQQCPRPAVENRAAALGRHRRPTDLRAALPARDEQVKPHRASSV
jgi:Rhodopirellula transposase DDE domain